MTLGTLVAGGLLVAVAAFAVFALVRIQRTMRRTRQLTRFQHAAADVSRRLAAETAPLVRDLEDMRRRSTDPSVVATRLQTTIPTLQALTSEARTALDPPPGLDPLALALAGEVSRAQRSAELAQSGVEAILDTRASRGAEASTAFKRATLNLRNATDEAARVAARIGSLRPADLDRTGAVAGAVATATLPTYGTFDDDPPTGP